jgi:uncharacterized protein YceH (UPF0502 family)
MARTLIVTLDEGLYEELVRRAGGPRKVSKYLNPLLRSTFSQPDTDVTARVAALEQEVAQLRQNQKGG